MVYSRIKKIRFNHFMMIGFVFLFLQFMLFNLVYANNSQPESVLIMYPENSSEASQKTVAAGDRISFSYIIENKSSYDVVLNSLRSINSLNIDLENRKKIEAFQIYIYQTDQESCNNGSSLEIDEKEEKLDKSERYLFFDISIEQEDGHPSDKTVKSCLFKAGSKKKVVFEIKTRSGIRKDQVFSFPIEGSFYYFENKTQNIPTRVENWVAKDQSTQRPFFNSIFIKSQFYDSVDLFFYTKIDLSNPEYAFLANNLSDNAHPFGLSQRLAPIKVITEDDDGRFRFYLRVENNSNIDREYKFSFDPFLIKENMPFLKDWKVIIETFGSFPNSFVFDNSQIEDISLLLRGINSTALEAKNYADIHIILSPPPVQDWNYINPDSNSPYLRSDYNQDGIFEQPIVFGVIEESNRSNPTQDYMLLHFQHKDKLQKHEAFTSPDQELQLNKESVLANSTRTVFHDIQNNGNIILMIHDLNKRDLGMDSSYNVFKFITGQSELKESVELDDSYFLGVGETLRIERNILFNEPSSFKNDQFTAGFADYRFDVKINGQQISFNRDYRIVRPIIKMKKTFYLDKNCAKNELSRVKLTGEENQIVKDKDCLEVHFKLQKTISWNALDHTLEKSIASQQGKIFSEFDPEDITFKFSIPAGLSYHDNSLKIKLDGGSEIDSQTTPLKLTTNYKELSFAFDKFSDLTNDPKIFNLEFIFQLNAGTQ